jgi:hypothetical protein
MQGSQHLTYSKISRYLVLFEDHQKTIPNTIITINYQLPLAIDTKVTIKLRNYVNWQNQFNKLS